MCVCGGRVGMDGVYRRRWYKGVRGGSLLVLLQGKEMNRWVHEITTGEDVSTKGGGISTEGVRRGRGEQSTANVLSPFVLYQLINHSMKTRASQAPRNPE